MKYVEPSKKLNHFGSQFSLVIDKSFGNYNFFILWLNKRAKRHVFTTLITTTFPNYRLPFAQLLPAMVQ